MKRIGGSLAPRLTINEASTCAVRRNGWPGWVLRYCHDGFFPSSPCAAPLSPATDYMAFLRFLVSYFPSSPCTALRPANDYMSFLLFFVSNFPSSPLTALSPAADYTSFLWFLVSYFSSLPCAAPPRLATDYMSFLLFLISYFPSSPITALRPTADYMSFLLFLVFISPSRPAPLFPQPMTLDGRGRKTIINNNTCFTLPKLTKYKNLLRPKNAEIKVCKRLTGYMSFLFFLLH